MAKTLVPKERKEIEELVKRHKAVFEVHPAFNYTQGERRQIGFDLVLYGTHEHASHPPLPGCDECVPVWRDLEQIARAIIPPDDRKSRFAVLPFDRLLYSSKARKFRDDVELVITVRHKEQFLDPLDACESHCLNEMIDSLKGLGVQNRTWEEYRARWFGQDGH